MLVNSVQSDLLFYDRYKFDDERVTKEDMKRALEEQYGGEEEVCLNDSITLCFCVHTFVWIHFCFCATVATDKSRFQ